MQITTSQVSSLVKHLDGFFLDAKRGKLKSPPWIKDPRIRDQNVKDLGKYDSIVELLSGIYEIEGYEYSNQTVRLSKLNSLLFTSCHKLFSMEDPKHPRLIRFLHSFSHIDGPLVDFLSTNSYFTKTSLIFDTGCIIGCRSLSKIEEEVFLFFAIERLDFLSKNDYSIASLRESYDSSIAETQSLNRFYLILSEAVLLAFALYISTLVLPRSSQRLCRMKLKCFLKPIFQEFKECFEYLNYERESKSLYNFCTKSKPFYKITMKGLGTMRSMNSTDTSLCGFIRLLTSIQRVKHPENGIYTQVNKLLTPIVLEFVSELIDYPFI
jgi:hypothetical protein